MSTPQIIKPQYPQEIVAPVTTTTYEAQAVGSIRTNDPVVAATTYNNRSVIAQETTGYPSVLFSEQLFGRGVPTFTESVEAIGTFSPASLQPPLSLVGSTVLEKGRMISPMTFEYKPKIGVRTKEAKVVLGEQKTAAGQIFDDNATNAVVDNFTKRISNGSLNRNIGEDWDNLQVNRADMYAGYNDPTIPIGARFAMIDWYGYVYYMNYNRTYYEKIAVAVKKILASFENLVRNDGTIVTKDQMVTELSNYLYFGNQTQPTLSGLLNSIQNNLKINNASRQKVEIAASELYDTQAVYRNEFFILYRYKNIFGKSIRPIHFPESGSGRFLSKTKKQFYTDENPLYPREYDIKKVSEILKSNSVTTADDLILAIQETYSNSANFNIGSANFIANVLPETMTANYTEKAISLFASRGVSGLTVANKTTGDYFVKLSAFKQISAFEQFFNFDYRYLDVWNIGSSSYVAGVINQRGMYANLSWLLLLFDGTTVTSVTYPITLFTESIASEEMVGGQTTQELFSEKVTSALYPVISFDDKANKEFSVGKTDMQDITESDAMFFEALCSFHNLMCQITRLAAASLLGQVYNTKSEDQSQQYFSIALLNNKNNMSKIGEATYRLGISGLTAASEDMETEFREKNDNTLLNILGVREGQGSYSDLATVAIGAMSYKKTELYTLFEELNSQIEGFLGERFVFANNPIVTKLLSLKNNQSFLKVLQTCLFNDQTYQYFDIQNAPFFARTTALKQFVNIGDLNIAIIANIFRDFFLASEVVEMLRPPFKVIKPIATSAFRHYLSFDSEEKVTALYALEDSLLVGTNKAIYGLYGNTSETVRQTKLSDGGVAYAGLGTVGNALLFVSGDRKHLYAYSQYQYQSPNQAGGVKYFLQDALPFLLQDLKENIYKFVSFGSYGFMILDNGRLFRISTNGESFGASEYILHDDEKNRLLVKDVNLVERPLNNLSSNPAIERGLFLLLKRNNDYVFGYYSDNNEIRSDIWGDKTIPIYSKISFVDFYKGALQIGQIKSIQVSGKNLKEMSYGVEASGEKSNYGKFRVFNANNESSTVEAKVMGSNITGNKNVIIEDESELDTQVSNIQFLVRSS